MSPIVPAIYCQRLGETWLLPHIYSVNDIYIHGFHEPVILAVTVHTDVGKNLIKQVTPRSSRSELKSHAG